MLDKHEPEQVIATLGIMGLLIGLGQLLASKETLTARIILGRALSSAGLGASAASVLAFIPDLSLPALCGIACTIASLGTSFLERLVQKLFNIR